MCVCVCVCVLNRKDPSETKQTKSTFIDAKYEIRIPSPVPIRACGTPCQDMDPGKSVTVIRKRGDKCAEEKP